MPFHSPLHTAANTIVNCISWSGSAAYSLACSPDSRSSNLVNFRRFGRAVATPARSPAPPIFDRRNLWISVVSGPSGRCRLAISIYACALLRYPFVDSREFPSFPSTRTRVNQRRFMRSCSPRNDRFYVLVPRAMTITTSLACSLASRSSFLVNFRRFETEPGPTRRRDSSPFLLLCSQNTKFDPFVASPKLEEFRRLRSSTPSPVESRDSSTLSARTSGGHRSCRWFPCAFEGFSLDILA